MYWQSSKETDAKRQEGLIKQLETYTQTNINTNGTEIGNENGIGIENQHRYQESRFPLSTGTYSQEPVIFWTNHHYFECNSPT